MVGIPDKQSYIFENAISNILIMLSLKGEIISRDLFNSANALRCTFPITDETIHEANSATNEAFNNL